MPEDTNNEQPAMQIEPQSGSLMAQVTAQGVNLITPLGPFTGFNVFVPAHMWIELTRKLHEERKAQEDVQRVMSNVRRLH